MDIGKKVALVTGAARGIGRAIAVGLAKEGADVIANYRTKLDAAEEVVKEIEKVGSKAISVRADVANEAEVQSMVNLAMEKTGSIDILVNNAAIHRGEGFRNCPLKTGTLSFILS